MVKNSLFHTKSPYSTKLNKIRTSYFNKNYVRNLHFLKSKLPPKKKQNHSNTNFSVTVPVNPYLSQLKNLYLVIKKIGTVPVRFYILIRVRVISSGLIQKNSPKNLGTRTIIAAPCPVYGTYQTLVIIMIPLLSIPRVYKVFTGIFVPINRTALLQHNQRCFA